MFECVSDFDRKQEQKYAVLNVTAIINMIEEAQYQYDREESNWILNELVDILEKSDPIN